MSPDDEERPVDAARQFPHGQGEIVEGGARGQARQGLRGGAVARFCGGVGKPEP